jgi:C-terminal peptidase prc
VAVLVSAASAGSPALDFDLVEKVLRPSSCLSDGMRWVGCLEGLNAALALKGKRLEWDGGRFRIAVKSAAADRDWPALFKAERADEDSRRRTWAGVRGQVSAMDYETLVRDVRAAVTAARNETALATEIFNAYYPIVLGPHARIELEADTHSGFAATGESASGIGIYANWWRGLTLVFAAVDTAPAAQAGIRANDWITHVDGEDIRGWALDDVTARIAGEEGSTVRLTVRRGSRPLEVSIVRKQLEVPNVQGRLLGKWGYIQVHDLMSSGVCDDVQWKVRDMEKEGARGWILDLRDNLGGQVKQGGVCVASLFLKKGVTVLTEKRRTDGKEYSYTTWENGVTDLPLVILVNGNTASAAEIVAGSLQGLGRALLIGRRTYGKGTIQSASRWKEAPGVLLFETSDCFLLPPEKHTNQAVGLTPDIPAGEDVFALRESVLFSNPIDCGNRRYTPPRVSECVARAGSKDPLLVAQDALDCATLH